MNDRPTGTLRSFARNFSGSPAPETADASTTRTPADVWLNVGYEMQSTDEQTGEPITVFIGTPLGIALDTQSGIDTSKTRSANLLKVQNRQNALLSQLQEAAKELKPGEEVTLNLVVQMRRVKGPAEAPVDNDQPFVVEMQSRTA